MQGGQLLFFTFLVISPEQMSDFKQITKPNYIFETVYKIDYEFIVLVGTEMHSAR